MPAFNERSLERLSTCHEDLRRVFNLVILEFDCSVLCGFRNREEQERALIEKKTKAPWPRSKHNHLPSLAIDVVPYPVNWNDVHSFKVLSQVVLRIAHECNVKIKWGGEWQELQDLPHYELET